MQRDIAGVLAGNEPFCLFTGLLLDRLLTVYGLGDIKRRLSFRHRDRRLALVFDRQFFVLAGGGRLVRVLAGHISVIRQRDLLVNVILRDGVGAGALVGIAYRKFGLAFLEVFRGIAAVRASGLRRDGAGQIKGFLILDPVICQLHVFKIDIAAVLTGQNELCLAISSDFGRLFFVDGLLQRDLRSRFEHAEVVLGVRLRLAGVVFLRLRFSHGNDLAVPRTGSTLTGFGVDVGFLKRADHHTVVAALYGLERVVAVLIRLGGSRHNGFTVVVLLDLTVFVYFVEGHGVARQVLFAVLLLLVPVLVVIDGTRDLRSVDLGLDGIRLRHGQCPNARCLCSVSIGGVHGGNTRGVDVQVAVLVSVRLEVQLVGIVGVRFHQGAVKAQRCNVPSPGLRLFLDDFLGQQLPVGVARGLVNIPLGGLSRVFTRVEVSLALRVGRAHRHSLRVVVGVVDLTAFHAACAYIFRHVFQPILTIELSAPPIAVERQHVNELRGSQLCIGVVGQLQRVLKRSVMINELVLSRLLQAHSDNVGDSQSRQRCTRVQRSVVLRLIFTRCKGVLIGGGSDGLNGRVLLQRLDSFIQFQLWRSRYAVRVHDVELLARSCPRRSHDRECRLRLTVVPRLEEVRGLSGILIRPADGEERVVVRVVSFVFLV